MYTYFTWRVMYFPQCTYVCTWITVIVCPLKEWPSLWKPHERDLSLEFAVNYIISNEWGCHECALRNPTRPSLNLSESRIAMVKEELRISDKGLRRSSRRKTIAEKKPDSDNFITCQKCHVTLHKGCHDNNIEDSSKWTCPACQTCDTHPVSSITTYATCMHG